MSRTTSSMGQSPRIFLLPLRARRPSFWTCPEINSPGWSRVHCLDLWMQLCMSATIRLLESPRKYVSKKDGTAGMWDDTAATPFFAHRKPLIPVRVVRLTRTGTARPVPTLLSMAIPNAMLLMTAALLFLFRQDYLPPSWLVPRPWLLG